MRIAGLKIRSHAGLGFGDPKNCIPQFFGEAWRPNQFRIDQRVAEGIQLGDIFFQTQPPDFGEGIGGLIVTTPDAGGGPDLYDIHNVVLPVVPAPNVCPVC
jgi:hypothetical protein